MGKTAQTASYHMCNVAQHQKNQKRSIEHRMPNEGGERQHARAKDERVKKASKQAVKRNEQQR